MDRIEIAEQDIHNEKVRQGLIDFLAPHETHALFLVANLQCNLQPSFLYVARQHGRIVGVCGLYPTFHSCTIYSEHSEASRSLAQAALKNHSPINGLMGMANMVKPAYEEFLAHGKKSIIDPEMDFFEMSINNFKPFTTPDGSIRLMGENDIEDVARLHHLVYHVSMDDPVTKDERVRTKASFLTFCLEIDGKIVAIASCNGLAIKAFQILGVATHPDFQRKGYAKAVCSHLIQYMQKKGGTKAIIFTGHDNVAARKCYLALGFQITDRYFVGMFQPEGP